MPVTQTTASSRTATDGEVASTTSATSSGPVIHTTSCTTESSAYAVSRTIGSGNTSCIRARAVGDTGGISAPDRPASTTSTAAPARPLLASTNAINTSACSSAHGARTRARPKRSTSRPWSGALAALANANAPTASPAIA